MSEAPDPERCPKCNTTSFNVVMHKPRAIGPTVLKATDPLSYERHCDCGHRWHHPDHLAQEDARQAAVEREGRTLRYAGAEPIVERIGEQGLRVYAAPSPLESRGVPNVTVFLFPNGQTGAALEKACTVELKKAFDAALSALASTYGSRKPDWDSCNHLHTMLVTWLRQQWNIGRITRNGDGEWDFYSVPLHAI